MTCLILNLGCECQTIVVSLKNGALHQSSEQGIYQRAGKVNGKTSWISSSGHALWYNPGSSDWMIASVDYLGTSSGSISSTGDQGISSCPYNVPNDAWEYVIDGKWIITDANDVSLECLGNLSLSMTQLLTHSVAHSTKPSSRPKTNNQPLKKFLSLVYS